MSSQDEYQHKTFCEEVKMRSSFKLLKVKLKIFPGLCLGISCPMTHYEDIVIGILCFSINIKFRKK